MSAINRAVSEWFIEAYSLQLLILFMALAAVVRHLVRNGQTLSERRFVGLSVVAGLLALLVVGAAFRTPTLARLLGLPAGGIVEKALSWIKAAFFETWSPNPAGAAVPSHPVTPPTLLSRAVLTALALATVILGFYQQPLTSWLMP